MVFLSFVRGWGSRVLWRRRDVPLISPQGFAITIGTGNPGGREDRIPVEVVGQARGVRAWASTQFDEARRVFDPSHGASTGYGGR
jgi:hypothetical protein